MAFDKRFASIKYVSRSTRNAPTAQSMRRKLPWARLVRGRRLQVSRNRYLTECETDYTGPYLWCDRLEHSSQCYRIALISTSGDDDEHFSMPAPTGNSHWTRLSHRRDRPPFHWSRFGSHATSAGALCVYRPCTCVSNQTTCSQDRARETYEGLS